MNSIIDHQIELELLEVEKEKTDAEKLSEITKKVLEKVDIVLLKIEQRKK
jgi:hypothetical protein